MRKAIRVTVAVLLAYLLQATALPYLKINGVMLDLVSVTLFTIGYALGLYAGLSAGLLAALIMETSTGDLSGITAFACVTAGIVGVVLKRWLAKLSMPGNRTREKLIRRYAPIVVVGAFCWAKEAVYVVYFYLTGVEIEFMHIVRFLIAGLEAMAASLVLLPLIGNLLTRAPGHGIIARRLRKRRLRRKPKQAAPETAPAPASPKGGMDA